MVDNKRRFITYFFLSCCDVRPILGLESSGDTTLWFFVSGSRCLRVRKPPAAEQSPMVTVKRKNGRRIHCHFQINNYNGRVRKGLFTIFLKNISSISKLVFFCKPSIFIEYLYGALCIVLQAHQIIEVKLIYSTLLDSSDRCQNCRGSRKKAAGMPPTEALHDRESISLLY